MCDLILSLYLGLVALLLIAILIYIYMELVESYDDLNLIVKKIKYKRGGMMYTKLKYDGFEKYLYEATKETLSHKESYQYIFKFDNGYGASVIKNSISYGHEQDLFELAVIEFIDEFTWKICCSTDITDDVLGYLENDDVLDLLERIKNL